MIIKIIFSALILFMLIRATAFGIYSIKRTGVISGIGVFILAMGSLLTIYMIYWGNG